MATKLGGQPDQGIRDPPAGLTETNDNSLVALGARVNHGAPGRKGVTQETGRGPATRLAAGYCCRAASRAAVRTGRASKRSATKPKSATSKIGASASLLMATMVLLLRMPAKC